VDWTQQSSGYIYIICGYVYMNGVMYTKYLTDGDKKGFLKVVQANVLGEAEDGNQNANSTYRKEWGLYLCKPQRALKGT
jgi:hypothetical protein